ADRDEPQPGRPVRALVAVPLAALEDDAGDPGQGLDVVDDRGPVEQAVGGGERRLVARLAATVLHRLQQRRLLALDVAAGTDEQFQLEGEGRSENTLAQGALLARLGDGLAGRLDFLMVFMAAV